MKLFSQFYVFVHSRTRPLSMKDKCICYILVLSMLAFNNVINLEIFTKDLKLGLKKLQDISKVLAFTFRSSNKSNAFLCLPLPPPVNASSGRKRQWLMKESLIVSVIFSSVNVFFFVYCLKWKKYNLKYFCNFQYDFTSPLAEWKKRWETKFSSFKIHTYILFKYIYLCTRKKMLQLNFFSTKSISVLFSFSLCFIFNLGFNFF